ncbi:MobP1 family relaxase [Pantoea endophytica]|uniref:MobP1 family relaxase n=1 Tax=Pantoea sp. BJ2 TaxID=3141322 RepID=A0AAU7U468_9GAMM
MGVKIDDDYRIRKGGGQGDKARRLPVAHKLRNGGTNYEKKLKERIASKGASREVMLKITGNSKTARGIKNEINYITREGELRLQDGDGKDYILNDSGERKDAYEYLTDPEDKHTYKDNSAPNIVHNMVFSAPKISGVTEEDALKAVEDTLKRKYPDNRFVMAYHKDKDHHPHVHALLRIPDNMGKRVNLRKSDLRDLREGFCHNLQNMGYDVKATHKHQIGLKQQLKREPERLRNLYEVVEFGRASYQFDPKNKMQNYIKLRTLKNKTEVIRWGANLADEIKREGISNGSIIKMSKQGETSVKVPRINEGGVQDGWIETKRNNWRLENQGAIGIERKPFDKEIKMNAPENVLKNKLGYDSFRQNMEDLRSKSLKHEKSLKIGLLKF